jgi:hypothetical protein
METWSQDMVDLVQPGFFEFDSEGMGEFAFIALRGWVDVRVSTREPILEYSWQGASEGE